MLSFNLLCRVVMLFFSISCIKQNDYKKGIKTKTTVDSKAVIKYYYFYYPQSVSEKIGS